jgi:phosphoglycolate phosphatase
MPSPLPLSQPPAIFFDLDGTLVDSAPDLGGACDWLRSQRGLPPLGTAAYRPAASAGARGLLQVAFGVQAEDAEFEPLRQQFIARYEAHLADNTYAFDGIAELIAGLQTRGIAWGIITNKSIELTRILVSRMPLLQSAAAVVGGNSAAAPKPSAAPMILAAQQAGVDMRQCWYVGDDERDIQAARAAHMACAIAAGWGYAPSSSVHTWGADAVHSSPLQILTMLDSLPAA